MAAEQVLTDVARQAGVMVEELWRRKPRGKADLPDMLRQLELVITGAFGVTVQLQLVREPTTGKPKSRRLFSSDEPAARKFTTVPATDGRTIWIPASGNDGEVIKDFENLRIMALQQAARVQRGSVATLLDSDDTLVRAIYEVLEADAADIDLVTRFRNLTGPLNAFRRMALELRPMPNELDAERRPLEHWVREILEIPCEAAAQSREHPASRSLKLAAELSVEMRKGMTDLSLASVLHRDVWVGELRFEVITARREGAAAGVPPARQTPTIDEPEIPSGIKSEIKLPSEPVTDPSLEVTQIMDAVQIERELADEETLPVPVWLEAAQVIDDEPDPSIEITQPMAVAATLIRPLVIPATLSPPAPVPISLVDHQEWDHRSNAYIEAGASLSLLPATPGPELWVDEALDRHHSLVQGIRQRFEALRAQRRQADEIDIDAHVDNFADVRAGLPQRNAAPPAARADVATLLLVELSPATQEWVSDSYRLIDLQREAVLLACLGLYSLGEPYGVFAYCGDGTGGTQLRCIKQFNESYSDDVARRIAGLEPEPHARSGAALRHAAQLLAEQTAQHRTLLLLSDGSPNDATDYQGRYGIEDMRQAVREARRDGISSLCFTTDQLSGNYLPNVFGEQQSTVLYRPELLPSALTQWLHRLMRS